MKVSFLDDIINILEQSIQIKDDTVTVLNPTKLRNNIHHLAEISALSTGNFQKWAQYYTRLVAAELGVYPASINDLYIARGKGEIPPSFTVPAINLRMLAFEAARAVFRAALSGDAGAFIFEIARSEMGYTDQRPSEYITSVLAAAVAEGYHGPVFVQGDHFQVSAKRFATDSVVELETLRYLMKEAISAGFFNIDVDASTLVDLSKTSLVEQQRSNIELTAMFTKFIRTIEPHGVSVSIGGEIGEVGGQNSTEPELKAFLDGYHTEVQKLGNQILGLSKISIQTGTSHGGVVLPDGSIADVSVDFDTLLHLSRIAREEYGLGGAVQHGASTLPDQAFGKFVESEACEVHLATNFMNICFDLLPQDLRNQMYVYLRENYASKQKDGMTDEQFYYKTRKNAIGPFKTQTWNLPISVKQEIGKTWEAQFTKLFKLLGIEGSRQYIDQTILAPKIKPSISDYLGDAGIQDEISDLAD